MNGNLLPCHSALGTTVMDRGKQLSVPGDPNDERALNSDERVGRAGLFSLDQPQLEVAIFFQIPNVATFR